MTQRIFNAQPTKPAEIAQEEQAPLDRAVPFPARKLLTGVPPRFDQQGGTCTAHAGYGVYAWWYRKQYGKFPPIGEEEILKFYDLMKKVDHDPDPERMHGSTLLTVLRTLAGSGFPFKDGSRGPKITGYHYVGNQAHDGRIAIAQFESPVIYRINWDAQWMYLPSSRILKPPIGQVIGGHAMYSVGYDLGVNVNYGGCDIDPNSWGAWSAGGNGICYFGEAYKDRPVAQYEVWQVTGIS